MGKVIENNSKVYISRPEFLYEIKEVMKTHSITLNQTMMLYFMLYNIKFDSNGADVVALYQKGLLKAGNTVVLTKLFGDKLKREQMEMKFEFTTVPKGSKDTVMLATNLGKAFVPDIELETKSIKSVADTYFKGDVGIAEYFIIFKYLFPRPNSAGNNLKWNTHFGFSYDAGSRWDDSMVVARKFTKIFITKDIGIFLSGLYYYIHDSINFDMGECYATKPNKFLDSYSSWYDLAKSKYEKSKLKGDSPKKSL